MRGKERFSASKKAAAPTVLGVQRGCGKILSRVPKGRLKIAQDAVLGKPDPIDPVPSGTAEFLCSCLQPSLRDCLVCLYSPRTASWAIFSRPFGTLDKVFPHPVKSYLDTKLNDGFSLVVGKAGGRLIQSPER
jgi:hypothetical protein